MSTNHFKQVDVAIVGAGPIGTNSPPAQACERQLHLFRCPLIGQHIDPVAAQYPLFSTTERLAIAGVPLQNNHQQRITGEDYPPICVALSSYLTCKSTRLSG